MYFSARAEGSAISVAISAAQTCFKHFRVSHCFKMVNCVTLLVYRQQQVFKVSVLELRQQVVDAWTEF